MDSHDGVGNARIVCIADNPVVPEGHGWYHSSNEDLYIGASLGTLGRGDGGGVQEGDCWRRALQAKKYVTPHPLCTSGQIRHMVSGRPPR